MTGHSRALLAEIAGTFLFITIGAGSIITQTFIGSPPGGLLAIALAHGLALAIAVSAFGRVSGGHFNPAVTFGLAVAGKQPWPRVLTYWAAQLIGALLAGLVLQAFFQHSPAAIDATKLGTPGLGKGVEVGQAILIEAVLTIFLLWAFFGTAVSPNAPRIAGFGIGFMVAADILLGGPLTGAAMNPARWFGPAVVSRYLDNWYVYWIGPLIGAGLAGLSYRYVFSGDGEREESVLPLIDVPHPSADHHVAPDQAPPAPRPSDRTERL